MVVYGVSSHDQRAGLDRQVARLTDWATANGHQVGDVVCEVGSTPDREAADVAARLVGGVCEGGDRGTSRPLTRFGVEHLEAAPAAHGREVVVADPGESTDDLVADMIEVLTSMCARLYGRRGARNRAMRAVTATEQTDEAPVV